MSGRKDRPRWRELPTRVREQIEDLVDDRVVGAQNCPGGFSPGFASRLTLATGRQAFAKAIDVAAWPSPLTVPDDHPRLGGWTSLKDGNGLGLRALSAWTARHVDELTALEHRGLLAARGTALVHFDALPHNISLTPGDAMLVDWPHARLGAPGIDVLTVLASAAADGTDPEPVLRAQPIAATVDAADVDAILAALSGFWLAGALNEACPAPVAAAKLHLGRGALRWLLCRLGITSTASWHRSYW